MKDKGLAVKVEPHYLQGPYVVLKLQVLSVNVDKLAETALEEKLGVTDSAIPTWVRRFESLIGEESAEKLETVVVPEFVQSRMTEMMPAMMKQKFSSKKLKAIPEVVKEADQRTYFLTKLRELDLNVDVDEL